MSAALNLATDDAEQPQRYARTLLSRVSIALRLCTMHALDNAAMTPPITNLLESIGEGLDDLGNLVLQIVSDNFFLNGEIIKLDFSSYEAGQALRGLLGRVGAQEIAFTEDPGEAGLRGFLAAYQKHNRGATPTEMLKEKLEGMRLRAISKAEEEALAPTLDSRKVLVRAYAQLALTIEGQLQLMKQKKQARLARVRRAIHSLADAAEAQESLVMALTRFDAFAGAVHFHLTATTALTLLLCRKLKLSRSTLSEACMAASLHDFGLDEVPPPNDPVATPAELDALKRVPVRTILRLTEGALVGDALERIAVAFENTSKAVPGQASFGQLIAVPCVFDRLTRPTPPRQAMLPDQALRLLYNQMGHRFDERIVRLFAVVMGLYPVGTTVKLNSGELALVVQVSGEPAGFAKPRVKVFRTAQGAPADYLIDLASPNEKRAIVGSVDPSQLQLNVPQFLLA